MTDPQHMTGPERDEYEARRYAEDDDSFGGQYGDKLQRIPLSGRAMKEMEEHEHEPKPCGRQLHMVQAKATPDDIRQMVDFFGMLEEAIEYGTYTADDESEPQTITPELLWNLVRTAWGQRGPGLGAGTWGRVIFGCDMLIRQLCNPDVDYLAVRPDIVEWFEAQKTEDET